MSLDVDTMMVIFKKIASLSLAIIILFATTGFTIHSHYCMGTLKDVAINQKAESCMGEMNQGETQECMMDCCTDTSQELKVKDFNKGHYKYNFATGTDFTASVSYFIFEIDLKGLSKTHSFNNQYKPLLKTPDIPVLVQSFLL